MTGRIRLLIADDEIQFLDSLAKRLEIRGFEVTKASNGRQALEYADQKRFDLALIDLKMPEIDGKRVLRHLKEHNDSVEVIIMTGHGSGESADECLRMGAFSYIPKPYELEKIIETFRQAYAAHLRDKHSTDSSLLDQLSVLKEKDDPLAALIGMRRLVE